MAEATTTDDVRREARRRKAALLEEARGNGHTLALHRVEGSPYGRAHWRGRCRDCGHWLNVVEFSNGDVSARGGTLVEWCG